MREEILDWHSFEKTEEARHFCVEPRFFFISKGGLCPSFVHVSGSCEWVVDKGSKRPHADAQGLYTNKPCSPILLLGPVSGCSASSLISSAARCSPPNPPPTTALTCVLRCFPCEPTWAGSPFLHRPPTPPMVRMTRSKTFQAYLPNCHRTYSCIHCRAHLANHDELISKSFQGSQGRAYLFNSVVNVGCGPAEERVLLTGLHAVADIYCENCKTTLGWKYLG
ncbi:Protein yippee-like 1 [Oryzias melastigma]|uniref:Protein yippee-like 1 n=1 Tax=Oryzias melastigma TaxID=30732 RepID=A0A834C4C0_ORYME|nr:Protein yippee-like 1 [Oryzias melastigma]